VIEFRLNNKTKREAVGKKNLVTKTMAREVLKKREQQVKLGQLDMLDNEVPTFRSFSKNYVHYITQINKKRSWKRDITSIEHFGNLFNEKKLSEITPGDIDDYKKIRLQVVKPATVNRELQCIRFMFNYAKREKKFLGDNPVSISGLLKVNNRMERILSYDEERRLLENCNEYLKDIIIIGLHTGMRRGEILNLR
jgi:integrase